MVVALFSGNLMFCCSNDKSTDTIKDQCGKPEHPLLKKNFLFFLKFFVYHDSASHDQKIELSVGSLNSCNKTYK